MSLNSPTLHLKRFNSKWRVEFDNDGAVVCRHLVQNQSFGLVFELLRDGQQHTLRNQAQFRVLLALFAVLPESRIDMSSYIEIEKEATWSAHKQELTLPVVKIGIVNKNAMNADFVLAAYAIELDSDAVVAGADSGISGLHVLAMTESEPLRVWSKRRLTAATPNSSNMRSSKSPAGAGKRRQDAIGHSCQRAQTWPGDTADPGPVTAIPTPAVSDAERVEPETAVSLFSQYEAKFQSHHHHHHRDAAALSALALAPKFLQLAAAFELLSVKERLLLFELLSEERHPLPVFSRARGMLEALIETTVPAAPEFYLHDPSLDALVADGTPNLLAFD